MSKIPDQYRVTLQKQVIRVMSNGEYVKDANGHYVTAETTPLGFANVYAPNTKAYGNRVATQDQWAYGHDCFLDNGKMWSKTRVWATDSNGQYVRDAAGNTILRIDTLPIADDLQPIIIDNKPMAGFKITNSINRSRTSNKLWRITDPRGFQLEITTANMEDIISGGVIDRGLIIGKCIWRTAKMLERV